MPIFQLSFYNPFREVIETKTFPHARTYRSNFVEMVKTAFYVFAGNGLMNGVFNKKLDKRKIHVGLFDYMTLGVGYLFPLFGKAVGEVAEREKIDKRANTAGTGLGWAITAVGYAARYLVAGALTFLSLPIIAVVAKRTAPERARLKAKALSNPVFASMVNENAPEAKGLKEAAKKMKTPVQDLLDIDLKSTGSKMMLLFNSITSKYNPNLPDEFPEAKKDQDNFVNSGIAQAMSQDPTVGVDVNEAFNPNSSFYALIHLNMGNLAQKLEARGFFAPENRNRPIDTTLPLEEAVAAPQQVNGL